MLSNWDKLIERIKSETRFRNGSHPSKQEQRLTAIRLTMLVDCNGCPISWIVQSNQVEPGNGAMRLLEAYSKDSIDVT